MSFDDALKEVAAGYPNATLAAGVQIAWLPDKNEFYCAVHAFPGNVASRKIVAKALGATSGEAISTCLATWRAIIKAEADARAANRVAGA